MTIIAYRNGALAADTAIYNEDTFIGHGRKLVLAPGNVLAGAAGDMTLVEEFLAHIEAERPVDDFKIAEDDDLEALVIYPAGLVIRVGPGGYFELRGDYHAIGSGSQVALGAMAAGAGAERAVEIAIERNAWCGGTVEVLKIKVCNAKAA